MLRWTLKLIKNGFYLHFVKLLGNHLIGHIHSDCRKDTTSTQKAVFTGSGDNTGPGGGGSEGLAWQLCTRGQGRPGSLGIKAFIRHIIAPWMISRLLPVSILYIIYIFSKVFKEEIVILWKCYFIFKIQHWITTFCVSNNIITWNKHF